MRQGRSAHWLEAVSPPRAQRATSKGGGCCVIADSATEGDACEQREPPKRRRLGAGWYAVRGTRYGAVRVAPARIGYGAS